ncbi:MAG: lipopolysaccharide biosynthesis protein [Candidatus Rokuibacteriota bacterium]|nr:MAG: lipopolysaccharide biosynthesis protein [Candidatus Rokubacteria bacterium]
MSAERTLLSGTAANVVGLGVGVAAAMATQILLGRTLLPGAFGIVTVAVQVAFVASAGTRFGMDMAAVRLVAIGRGARAADHLRSLVDRCALVAFAASVVLAAVLAASAPLFGDYDRAIALAAAGIPFIALTSVYLGAARGLTQMRQTLYVFWIGQPVVWIAFAGAAIAAGGESDAVILAYGASWLVASVAAWALWRREARAFAGRPATREEVRAALRYGLPRAPAALLAQAIFWADLWVLAAFEQGTELDAYSAAARISQVLLLFLTSLNLVFSPFAADLHARGERERLGELFKRSTRWALAATLPLLIVLFVAADDVLEAFSSRYEIGEGALRILLAGQAVNVATGGVAFILIMTGFTGVDLVDNALGLGLLVGLAVVLTAGFGMEGAATAAAVSIAVLNVVRLVQVRRRVGIQPYERVYLALALPAGAAALAAVGAHAALLGSAWWVSLLVTGACGLVAYVALLPLALSTHERVLLRQLPGRLRSGRPATP